MSQGNTVELSVRSQLQKIVAELEVITEQAKKVGDGLKESGQAVGDSLNDQAKKTETFLTRLRGLGRRVADQMRGDFRSLISLNAVSDAMKISNQFRGSVKEAMTLSDTIRKLGRTFGIAQGDFSRFQTAMVKGLGEVGLSSEVASRVLEGLADTTVRGENNVLGYSVAAGELASITRQQGREGDISSGIARVITARGGNANDLKEMRAVAEDLRRVFNQTGKGPTETLSAMEQLFTGMSKDFRQRIGSRGLVNLAAASQVAGPNSTKFLEEYLSTSPIARMAFEAQGGKGIIGADGIDLEKFAKFSKSILGRVGGDPRLAAQTLGLSDEAAEGFIRLSESLNQVKAAQDGIRNATGDLETQYRQSLGAAEAFKASINRVKGFLATPLSFLSQKGTDVLSSAAGSDLGAAGVVAGGGLLAALLAGAGLRGIGKGLLGGAVGTAVKGGLAEELTGQKTVPVYVTNAAEIAGGGLVGAAGGGLGKAAGLLGKAGLLGAAAAVGVGGGLLINKGLDKYTQGQNDDGFEGNAMERLIAKLDQLTGYRLSGTGDIARAHVKVELNKRDLKESKQPTRGASF